jgi:hypothetical protein
MRQLLPCLLLLIARPAFSASYYCAPGGSDSAAGTLAAPFATLQHGASVLSPGDTLYVRQGTYHEAAQLSHSGTASAPISIQAYPGECPLIDGAQPVTATWSLYSGQIYAAPWPSQPMQVFCDGQMLNEARWPAAGVEALSSQPVALADWGCTTALACSTLPPVDLTGAMIQDMAGQSWCSYTRQIASHDMANGILAFSAPINEMAALYPRRGDRFYVFGKLSLLTAPGEWFWDPGTSTLYVWAQAGNAPSPGEVEAGSAGPLLTLDNQSYINVSGLSARGGWFSLNPSSHCQVQDCHLQDATWTRACNGYSTSPYYAGAAFISGTANTWLDGSIAGSGRCGIVLSGVGNTVDGATIQDCAWNWANDGGILFESSDQGVAQNCTIQRSARAGIFMYSSTRAKVLHNLIQSVALYSSDIGNFDSWGTDSQGAEVAYNICRDNQAMWGAGIYLDDNAAGFYVHDNLVQGMAWFGYVLKAVNSYQNNTSMDAGHSAISCEPSQGLAVSAWSLSGAQVASNQLQEAFPVRISLQTGNVTDSGYYGGYAYLSAGAQRVELDWPQLGQPWWAIQVPMSLTATTTISFGMECLADYSYSISNLRYLPAVMGATPDSGAVAVNASWYAAAGSGSTSTLTSTSPPSASGSSVPDGWNMLGAYLNNTVTAGAALDLSQYRGIAFEISGSATRSYATAGCAASNNGPTAPGASLPAVTGANPQNALSACQRTPLPTATISPTFTASPSATPTASPGSPTPSPTRTPASGPPDLAKALPVPNPGCGRMLCLLRGDADRLQLRAYSAAFNAAGSIEAPGAFSAGWASVDLSPLSGLPGGLYWVRVQGFKDGKAGRSALVKWYVMR